MTTESQALATLVADLEDNILDYLKAQDAGTAPLPEEWIAQHPQYAEQLRAYFHLEPTMHPLRDDMPPRDFGGYRGLRRIGRGGMGVVYCAWQCNLERAVAIKMMRDPHRVDKTMVARFLTDAQHAARLNHNHVIKVHEVGEFQGLPYFTMEYIRGGSLANRIVPGQPLAVTRDDQRHAARLLLAVAEAVQHAHQRGIIHRDLKPANILLHSPDEATSTATSWQVLSDVPTQVGSTTAPAPQAVPGDPAPAVQTPLRQVIPIVTDFGLAQRREEQSPDGEGAIAGTANYMAPEQARGLPDLTTAVDVYGLGAILYEMLTGVPPFQAETTLDVLVKVIEQPPEPPRTKWTTVDRDLQVICLKCLEKDPANRYLSAQAVADELRRWLEGVPIEGRPVGRVERLGKWARRRPAVATLLGTVSLLLVGGLITFAALWLMAEYNRERREEQHYITLIKSAAQYSGEGRYDEADKCLEDCPPRFRCWEWHYLHRLTLRDRRLLENEHRLPVSGLCFSPDGRTLATVGDDGVALLWNLETGKVRHRLPPHPGGATSVSFGANGAWVATSGNDGTVHISDAVQGVKQVTIPGVGPLVAASRQSNLLVAVDRHNQLTVWKIESGAPAKVWPEPAPLKRPVSHVAISPNGKYVAVCGLGTHYDLWDVQRQQRVPLPELSLDDKLGGIFTVAFSNDSRHLAIGTSPLAVVDVEKGTLVRSYFGSNILRCGGLAFSPDGKHVAATYRDELVRVWDVGSGRIVLIPRKEFPFDSCVDFSPDGKRLALGARQNVVLLDLQPSQRVLTRTLSGHTDSHCGAVVFSGDGNRLVSRAGEREVIVWDPYTGASLQRLTLVNPQVPTSNLALHPHDDVLVVGGKGETLEMWDLRHSPPRHSARIAAPGTRFVAFDKDGDLLATCDGKQVDIWDYRSGAKLFGPVSFQQDLLAMAFHPHERKFAVAGQSGVVILWDLERGEVGRDDKGHLRAVQALAFSADGKLLASAGVDLTVRVRPVSNFANVQKFSGQAGAIFGLAFSPDGDRLATCGADGTVTLNGANQAILVLSGHRGQVTAAAFRSDGLLATCSHDGTVRLWDGRKLD